MTRVRELLRRQCRHVGFGLVDETKIVTAGSELARNIVKYAREAGGEVRVEKVERAGRRGLRVTFRDTGPGIADVPSAMQDGFSTGGSFGLGLPGSRRLVDEFDITSKPGEGTRVVIVKWLR